MFHEFPRPENPDPIPAPVTVQNLSPIYSVQRSLTAACKGQVCSVKFLKPKIIFFGKMYNEIRKEGKKEFNKERKNLLIKSLTRLAN